MHQNAKSPNRPCTNCGAKPPVARFDDRTACGRTFRHSWCIDCQRSYNREYKRKKRAAEAAGIGPRFGEKHPNAKLTSHDVALIWGLIDVGLSNKEIGDKFEVSLNTIWSIRSGRTWQHCHPDNAI